MKVFEKVTCVKTCVALFVCGLVCDVLILMDP